MAKLIVDLHEEFTIESKFIETYGDDRKMIFVNDGMVKGKMSVTNVRLDIAEYNEQRRTGFIRRVLLNPKDILALSDHIKEINNTVTEGPPPDELPF